MSQNIHTELPGPFGWPVTLIAAVTLVSCTALLGGCGGTVVPVDAAQLARPEKTLMQSPRSMPDIPRDESTNVEARAAYYAESRNVCGANSARLGGLQSYVRALHGDPNPAAPMKLKPRTAATQVARVTP